MKATTLNPILLVDSHHGVYSGQLAYKRAEKTYHAVVKEYTDLCTLYSDEELQILAEIQ